MTAKEKETEQPESRKCDCWLNNDTCKCEFYEDKNDY